MFTSLLSLHTLLFIFSVQAATTPNLVGDSWYTMQAGSTPWGYYHEIIEKTESTYNYRYTLKKIEGPNTYDENTGAVCKLDLTPMSMNVFKRTPEGTQVVDVTYGEDTKGSFVNVAITGSKTLKKVRRLEKDTIFDVFFPLYILKNWSKLKPGFKGFLPIFTEDPVEQDFLTRRLSFDVKNFEKEKDCLNIFVTISPSPDPIRWCMNKNGILIEMDGPKTNPYRVRRVKSEAEAKKFVSGLLKKE